MKKIFYSALCIPVLLSCGVEEPDTNDTQSETTDTVDNKIVEEEETAEIINSITITENVVGIFELGKKVPPKLPDELRIRGFVETETAPDGTILKHKHNVIFNQLEDVLELIMDQGSSKHHEGRLIKEMFVLSNYYETPEGISVGSTIEDFQYAYDDATIWYSADHNRYVMETEEIVGAQFILKDADIKKKASGSGMVKINFSYAKPGAEIKRIRLY